MERASLIFCAAALTVSLGVAAIAFPFAALSEDELHRARTPAAAETLPEVDLGGGFGRVPVLDLVGYYIENPPEPATAGGAAARVRHFGGC